MTSPVQRWYSLLVALILPIIWCGCGAVASDQEAKVKIGIFRVVSGASGFFIPFAFEDKETGQSIRGLRSADTALTLADIEELKLTTTELSGRPRTGLAISYKSSALRRFLDQNLEPKSAFVVIFADCPCAMIKRDTIQSMIDQRVPLFLLLPIKTAEDYERFAVYIKNLRVNSGNP